MKNNPSVFTLTDLSQKIARLLLQIEAVGFRPDNPITFKSGIISPVYVDNRKLPFFPQAWKEIIMGFSQIITTENLTFDIIAGIETAGIPHSAALGFALNKPSVFVRKKAKDHGTKKRVEGGIVKNEKVLLVEDLVTTGGSSLAGVDALRQEGAQVEDCLIIVSYGFTESVQAFDQAKIKIHALTTFPVILAEAYEMGMYTKKQYELIKDWFNDPHGWNKN